MENKQLLENTRSYCKFKSSSKLVTMVTRPMKVDIVFLFNHFRKVGEEFFQYSLFFYILKEVATSMQ